jgi:O-acetyl-ADP-ribose deacetylase
MNEYSVRIIKGDITRQNIDAIVNAANTSLLGGGGVDGAIHRGAGPQLLKECRKLNGCRTGQAKITKGYALPAKWIIHTVGPVWRGGDHNEKQLLNECYKNSLALADLYNIESIAFPSISTGAYHFPLKTASETAIKQVCSYLSKTKTNIKTVYFVCFNQEVYDCYQDIYRKTNY